MHKQEEYEAIASDPRFHANIQRKGRMLWLLMLAFICYYFALLAGAAYYRPLFSELCIGKLNVGMVFALSQYAFAGGIALYYAHYMKSVDSAMHELVAAKASH